MRRAPRLPRAAAARVPRALLVIALLGGCAPVVPRGGPDDEATTAPTLEGLPTVFPRFGEFEGLPVASRLRTAHPVGDYAATIRVDAGAAGYGKAARAPMPIGAMIVEALSLDPDAPPALYYVMVRRDPGFFPEGGDWEYAVVSSEGVVRAGGKLPLCARCHGEAPRDHLFEHVVE